MDLRQLEIIRAIAETGSFTAAGHKLHVSQSAISRQILLLEDELKEPVFLRVGRRIRITPAGESLLQLSHRVFQDLKDTTAGITDSQESLARHGPPARRHDGVPLRVSAAAHRAQAAASGNRLEADDRQLRAVLAAAALGRRRPGAADAAGRSAGPGDGAGAAGRAAGRDGGQASAVEEAQGAAARTWSASRSCCSNPGSNTRRAVDEFFMTARIEPQIVMETENVEIIKALVRHGLGITIIPYQAVARDVTAGPDVLRPHRGPLAGPRNRAGSTRR